MSAVRTASGVIGVILAGLGFVTFVLAAIMSFFPPIAAFLALFGIVFLAGGALLLYQSFRSTTVAQVPSVPSPAYTPPPGTVVKPSQPGTIVIAPPSGGTITVTAWLQGPGKSIPITSLPQTFGRDNFRDIVDPVSLNAISRRHFTIGYDYVNRTFAIWDEGSTNGTYVNGVDIRGKGPVPIKYGDVISPANVISLRFSPSA